MRAAVTHGKWLALSFLSILSACGGGDGGKTLTDDSPAPIAEMSAVLVTDPVSSSLISVKADANTWVTFFGAHPDGIGGGTLTGAGIAVGADDNKAKSSVDFAGDGKFSVKLPTGAKAVVGAVSDDVISFEATDDRGAKGMLWIHKSTGVIELKNSVSEIASTLAMEKAASLEPREVGKALASTGKINISCQDGNPINDADVNGFLRVFPPSSNGSPSFIDLAIRAERSGDGVYIYKLPEAGGSFSIDGMLTQLNSLIPTAVKSLCSTRSDLQSKYEEMSKIVSSMDMQIKMAAAWNSVYLAAAMPGIIASTLESIAAVCAASATMDRLSKLNTWILKTTGMDKAGEFVVDQVKRPGTNPRVPQSKPWTGGALPDFNFVFPCLVLQPALKSPYIPVHAARHIDVLAKDSKGQDAEPPSNMVWTSSDASVAAVNVADKSVSGVANGSAVIKGHDYDSGADVQVAVVVGPFKLEVSPATVRLQIGENFPLSVVARDEFGQVVELPSDIQWSSADPAIANVSASGVISPVKLGSTVVKAFSPSFSLTATTTVTVAGLPDITGTYTLVSYRGMGMGSFCGDSQGCGDPGFTLYAGTARMTPTSWSVEIRAIFDPKLFPSYGGQPVSIFSNSGPMQFLKKSTEPVNVPNEPDCMGEPHNVPSRFYCSQLPAGWLFGLDSGASSMVPYVSMQADGTTLVSMLGGQTVWKKVN